MASSVLPVGNHRVFQMFLRVCVCSNSRNDVPGVAQRYGTIAAHTRCRASVLVVFVVFCVHMYSFAGLIRRTPPPTFSDTAITNRHSDTTIFQLTGCRYPGLLDRKSRSDMCPRWESNFRLPACKLPGQARLIYTLFELENEKTYLRGLPRSTIQTALLSYTDGKTLEI